MLRRVSTKFAVGPAEFDPRRPKSGRFRPNCGRAIRFGMASTWPRANEGCVFDSQRGGFGQTHRRKSRRPKSGRSCSSPGRVWSMSHQGVDVGRISAARKRHRPNLIEPGPIWQRCVDVVQNMGHTWPWASSTGVGPTSVKFDPGAACPGRLRPDAGLHSENSHGPRSQTLTEQRRACPRPPRRPKLME